MIRRNLIANFAGQGWTGLMGIVFVPTYVYYLGIESYALIGLFAVLSAGLNLFDMGLTPMLSREMARLVGGAHTGQSIRDLLRSVEVITACTSICIAFGVASVSSWIATEWLVSESLPSSVVAEAFTVMGVVTAMRFVEALYRGCIIGLQKQVLLNLMSACIATVRWVGAALIVSQVSAKITSFFLWQGLVSVVATGIFCAITYRILPKAERFGRFSITALRKVWRFAGGMVSVTFLAFVLTQIDKILLSKLAPLSELGYYALAATVTSGLALICAPIRQAFYPVFCVLHERADNEALAAKFHLGAQTVSVLVGGVAIAIIVYSEKALMLWTQDSDLAAKTAPLLSILAFGNLLNSLMLIPYQAQLAHGWTSLSVFANLIAVIFFVPAIFIVVPIYGAAGAAWVWAALNAGYFLVSAQFLFKRILTNEKKSWYFHDSIFPISIGFLVATVGSILFSDVDSPLGISILLLFAPLVIITVMTLMTDSLRRELFRTLEPFARAIFRAW